MIDTRISVRLISEQHEKLKILVIKRKTSINQFLVDYIVKELEREENGNKKNKN